MENTPNTHTQQTGQMNAPINQPSGVPVAKRHLGGYYMTNVSIIGSKPALLEWTADDRIRLYILQADPQAAPEAILDVAVADVQSFYASLGYMVLRVQNRKYRLQVNDQVTAAIAAGGVVGLAYAHAQQESSGIKGWLADFKRYGVKTTYAGAKYVVVIAAIVFVIVLVAIGVYASSR